MREDAPVVRAQLPGGQVWLVTRHAEARQVLADPTISTSPLTPGHPDVKLSGREFTPEETAAIADFLTGSFINMDPPQHTAYRRLLIPEFSFRQIRELRPGIQQATDGLIDAMLAAPDRRADLVEAFGLALPSLVICQLLGVPYTEREFFQSRTRMMLASEDPTGGTAALELRAFLVDLIAKAEKAPGDDLLGRLVTTAQLPREEIAGMMFLLLVAGHETTANMIPLGVLTLLRHPGQLRRAVADPALWPPAVEELLRYHSVVDWIAFDRVATADLEVGGVQIRAGEGIYVLGAAANRDERAFADPGRFDIDRDARTHVAFGYGVHQCLGQNLARAELEIAYRTLFERVPTLRVELPDEELRFKYDGPIFGLHELPVAW
ncbi:cytochrome P450 [Spongiactinospora sp. TRM90649]|uniref:cytochrome P450 n=1 Tax=Spongiactinospora sp. TRM90649 TaxID=3031114 RepID=UPI0023F6C5DC|nr:cytochrome P450 [Spongiactinospora sp. TRM90649]MDF5754530.1 cytochrome P450 [Spongiactinospora sp. TRM90649]